VSDFVIEWSADCNADGIVDYGQILDGTLTDVNADGIPDVCQAPCVPADLNNDRSVDGADLGVLLSAWGPAGSEPTRADINGNGIVDGADLGVLLANWGACGEAPPWATVVQWQPDPAVVTNPVLRDAISATGLPWRVKDTATQIEMLLIPPGEFTMGCSASAQHGCAVDEHPIHQVTLTNALYLGRYEVTQAQWQATMGSNPSNFSGFADSDRRPVEQVSWNIIQGFLGATGMRLPTEAEWEYACRGGTTTAFHGWHANPGGTNEDSEVGAIAWYGANSGGQTHPIGTKAANGYGLHDMSGNVWEWTGTWYGDYDAFAQTNPTGPSLSEYIVLRGGAWADGAQSVRCSNRGWGGIGALLIGFRVARNP
jgi:formylglycine-generating enzyme required for sulfatase activity